MSVASFEPSLCTDSSYATTYESSVTAHGPGELSGKAIKALGRITLRGLDDVQLRVRFARWRQHFPHGEHILGEGDNGEEMYHILLDLSMCVLFAPRLRS